MSLTLAELAIHVPAAIPLFEKYELDYFQNGQRTLEEVCGEKGLSYDDLDNEMSLLRKEANDIYPMALIDMDIERLIDFLNGQYHADEQQVLAGIHFQIRQLLDRVPSVISHTLLNELERKFFQLSEKLIQHCWKEDRILFPYMRKLASLRNNRQVSRNNAEVSLIRNPVSILEDEHREALQLLSEIRKITRGFEAGPDSPEEYKKLMESFKEFEKDLHMHLHIENNILFPKITELQETLEKKLNQLHE